MSRTGEEPTSLTVAVFAVCIVVYVLAIIVLAFYGSCSFVAQ